MSDGDLVVEARGLVKRFGHVTALDGLDLDVRRGEVLGFLGPNGSGKTTTIRALLGQLRLDAGEVQVFGMDAWHDAVRIHERLAYVPGDVNLWGNLTGGECIDVLLSFHGTTDRSRRDELIERFELDPSKKTRTYSKGNRQKVALIAALATAAELLVLDEPTSGLDPLMEAQFRAMVQDITAAGRTVLLSSHILGEVDRLCDRVTIVRHGKAVTTGTLEDLRAQAATTASVDSAAPIPGLADLPGVTAVIEHPLPHGGLRIQARAKADGLSLLVHTMLDNGGHSLRVEPPTLDELFLEHYRDDPAAASP